MNVLKAAQRYVQQTNRRYSSRLEFAAPEEWKGLCSHGRQPVSVWRSKEFLAVVYQEGSGYRITVNRTNLIAFADDGSPLWQEGISWDELMDIKGQVGLGDAWAVEIYPPDDEVVNVANMRHLWVIDEPPYGWKRQAVRIDAEGQQAA